VTNDQPLTIAEAAERIGVPKKTLRHMLLRPDRRARLQREYRTTKKGLITIELVPLDLLNELTGAFPRDPAHSKPPPPLHNPLSRSWSAK